MQNEIDQLTAQIEALSKGNSGNQTSGNQTSGNQTSGNQTSGNQTSGNQPSGNSGDTQHVKATADINVRSSASTSGDILATVDSGAVMTYLGSASSSDGTWYNVKLSNGTVGYVASWYCSEIY